MKRNLFFLCALFLAFSVSGAGLKYTLTGKVPASMEGKTIYLTVFAKDAKLPVDSVVASKGQFVMKGELNTPLVAMVAGSRVLNMKDKSFLLVLEQGNVFVDFSAAKGDVKGGKLNERFSVYTDSIAALKQQQKDSGLGQKMIHYNDSTTTAAQKKETMDLYHFFNQRQSEIVKSIVELNMDNAVGAFLFANYKSAYPEEERDVILKKAGKNFLNDPLVQDIVKQIAAVKKRSAGNHFTDFELKDADGKQHKLSEYIGKGKYVLLDFWASWCGPCRAEMPSVKAAYEKYHAKGFEIVSVSLDSNKDAWLKAIEQLGMTWNHLSDLQGWKSSAAQVYGINSIPCTMLIGPDGMIVGTDYRKEQLSQKLAELLK